MSTFRYDAMVCLCATYRLYHHICNILQGANCLIIKWIAEEYLASHLPSIYTSCIVLRLHPQHPMTWLQCEYEDVIALWHTSKDVLHLTTLLLKLHPKWINDVKPLEPLLGQHVLHPHGEHVHGPYECHFPLLAYRPQIRVKHENCELESLTYTHMQARTYFQKTMQTYIHACVHPYIHWPTLFAYSGHIIN